MKIVYSLAIDRKTQGAAYNRVQMICCAMNSLGINCTLQLQRSPIFNFVWYRRFHLAYQLLCIAFKLLTLSKNDIYILYGENLGLKYILKMPRRAKLMVERNEYSTYLIRDNLSTSHVEAIENFEKLLSKCDGMIVCSTYLKKYYAQFTKVPIVIIPLVVDCAKFKPATTTPQPYIAYCGDFGGNKDGLSTLLESFASVSPKHSQYKLYLIGDTSEDATITVLRNRVAELNLTDKVVFTGRVQHAQMPKLLADASLLVLARPANKQAEGGIPSKLAEYLASGRPTLITRVGELDKYLVDKEDVYFATPDSIEDFADKIDYILSNYSQSIQIGINGAQSVKQFDYIHQSRILLNFIQQNVQR